MRSKFLRAIALLLSVVTLSMMAIGCSKKPVKGTSDKDVSSSSSLENELTSSDDSLKPGDDSQTGTDSNSTNPSNNASTPSGGKNPSQTPFKEPVYDLGGRTIKILWERGKIDESENQNKLFMDSVRETERKFNCKFQFTTKTDYVGLYETVIKDSSANKATFDAYLIRGYDVVPNLANSGAILAMDEKYDFAKDPTWQKPQVKDLGWLKGKKYGLTFEPNEYGAGIWYNNDMLSRAGIPDLWTYVNNNTWTWDTFRKICRQFMQKMGDTNGDGKRDNYAFTAEDPWLTFVACNEGKLVNIDANGKAQLALDSKNSLDALQLIADMHQDHSIPNGEELGKLTDKPFNAMFTGHVAMFPYHARYGEVLLAQNIKNFGWVYLPKGNAAKDYVVPSVTMPDMLVFPKALKEPEKIVAVVQDAFASWDTTKSNPFTLEKKTEELYKVLSNSLKGDAFKVLKKQALTPVYTWANNYPLPKLQTELWPMIIGNKKTVKNAVDSMKGSLQASLDQLYSGSIVK